MPDEYDRYHSEGNPEDDTHDLLADWRQPADAEGVHPDAWAYRPGVDYVRPWRTAKDATRRLRAALARVGIHPSQRPTIVLHTDGSSVVTVHLDLDAAARLAQLLDDSRTYRPSRL